MTAKLLFVCNNPAFFADQHMHLAEAARAAGHTVLVAAPEWPGAERIRRAGFAFLPIHMARGGLRPIADVRSIRELVRVYRVAAPDLVYHITLKPILYGTVAARLAGVPGVVNANTGLGYAFIDDSLTTSTLRGLLEKIYRRAIRHSNRVDLFLNQDDRELFLDRRLTESSLSAVINGPGVDTAEFHPVSEQDGTPIVVLPARLLWHKGVQEFVDAARLIRARGIDARFALVGDEDPGNLASISRDQLRAWNSEGVVEWWGYRHDMPEVYANSHVVALPSYREGLGKVIAEAGSCARPVVATDVPGCREIVADGVNGTLVPVRSAAALADALEPLITCAERRRQFGRQGRIIVESRFSETTVAKQTLRVIEHVLSGIRFEPGMLRVVIDRADKDFRSNEAIAPVAFAG
ncbi:MAG: glycosyltransferase family 4 protein [Rhodothermales bacterium]|nr:glycosyltransferase family 4 protein [Rhodothermales bacterium]MBO6780747.1 glycosyltransferase family 4 protein [Rhodothermales bacterium]